MKTARLQVHIFGAHMIKQGLAFPLLPGFRFFAA